jgi:hypothetical protein
MLRRLPWIVAATALAVAALAGPASGAGAGAGTLLRLDGIGPLKLGMTQAAAVRTGWLAGRTTGCPLGGPPLPIGYRFTGARAPKGIRGTAEFTNGRLSNLSFSRGVHTATGVTVGRTPIADMVAGYRGAGLRASSRYDAIFAGTFVTVRRGRRDVIGGFGEHRVVTLLAVRGVQVCE